MVTNLSRMYKKELDSQNQQLTEEIMNMKQFNAQLTSKLNEVSSLANCFEAEKNREINEKMSV